MSHFRLSIASRAQTTQDRKVEADCPLQQGKQDLQNNQDQAALRSSPQALVTFKEREIL
jgi:hypothetical protein